MKKIYTVVVLVAMTLLRFRAWETNHAAILPSRARMRSQALIVFTLKQPLTSYQRTSSQKIP
jgi:hypothetical protein